MRSSSRLADVFRGQPAPPAPPVAPVLAAAQGRDLYYRVGLFLFEHGLEPTPANYAFAHAYAVGDDAAIVAAVTAATAGQVRLTQKDIDKIVGAMPPPRLPSAPGSRPRISPA